MDENEIEDVNEISDSDGIVLFVSEDGSIEDTSSYESYGIRPVITFSKNTKILGGIGTKDDPYVVEVK